MAEKTEISWTDSTFNPWIGCTRVSPACDDCYAARSTPARAMGVVWGPKEARHRTAASTWAQPKRWEREHEAFFAEHGRRRRVFCASLADVFDNEVSMQWRIELLQLINETRNLDWLLLTKRIGNAGAMLETCMRAITAGREGWADNYLPNVWLGATVVNHEEADRDIPKLLALPARVRFLSIEPMLGPIELDRWLTIHKHWKSADSLPAAPWHPPYPKHWFQRQALVGAGWEQSLHWVIVGGESGPKARPMHPDWARSLRDQCAAAGVPFHFKQFGEFAPTQRTMAEVAASSRKLVSVPAGGGQFYPVALVDRVGKRVAGRLLDGVTHDGFPSDQEPGAA